MCLRYVVVAIALGASPALAQEPSLHPRIGQLAELTFPRGSADLAPGTEQPLGTIAAWARQNPDAHVVLDGHADRTGAAPLNVKLSLRRATAVREQLVLLGVDPDMIVVAAYGEAGPQKRNNRRVVVWGTRADIKAIVARSMHHKDSVLWSGFATGIEPARPTAVARRTP